MSAHPDLADTLQLNAMFTNKSTFGETTACLADVALRHMETAFDRLLSAAIQLKPGVIAGKSDLAKFLNESPQTITNWQSRGLPRSKILDVARAIGVAPEWLLDGTGSMVPQARDVSQDSASLTELRRSRLRMWIDEHCNSSQAHFVAITGVNQGELSGLLRTKSFGEKKARSLEHAAGMPAGWLDLGSAVSEAGKLLAKDEHYYIQASSPEDLAIKLAEKGNEEIARIIQLLLTHKDKTDGR